MKIRHIPLQNKIKRKIIKRIWIKLQIIDISGVWIKGKCAVQW